MKDSEQITIAPLLSEKTDGNPKVVGWAPVRIDYLTIQQREYMRRLRIRRNSQRTVATWRRHKDVA
jgi:hypothetical protein